MGTTLTTLREFGVFGDEIYTSTDLNRRSGEVLDRACMRPVTISRNNERFALLRREQAAGLFEAVHVLDKIVELLSEAKAAMAGEPPSASFSWLTIFDKDDLGKLCSEVLNETRSAFLGRTSWDTIESTIHEWHESATVAKSGIIDHVMYKETAEETLLPHPNRVIDSAPVACETACPKT
jgi:hypothetical protein